MPSTAKSIYKIMPDGDWRSFQLLGAYEGSDHDKADGFIHFSTIDQLQGTLDKHYAGQQNLILLEVDVDALVAAQVKWEEARDGALFPHLYGVLPLNAVRHALAIAVLEDGRFALPDDLAPHA